MTHDLLVLNNSSYDSETFRHAHAKFVKEDLGEYLNTGEDEQSLLETGFEHGFWSAVSALTGYKSGT